MSCLLLYLRPAEFLRKIRCWCASTDLQPPLDVGQRWTVPFLLWMLSPRLGKRFLPFKSRHGFRGVPLGLYPCVWGLFWKSIWMNIRVILELFAYPFQGYGLRCTTQDPVRALCRTVALAPRSGPYWNSQCQVPKTTAVGRLSCKLCPASPKLSYPPNVPPLGTLWSLLDGI